MCTSFLVGTEENSYTSALDTTFTILAKILMKLNINLISEVINRWSAISCNQTFALLPKPVLRRLRFLCCLLSLTTLLAYQTVFASAVGHPESKVSHPEPEGKVTILVLGDSLSSAYGMERERGWVNLLTTRLDTEFTGIKIINASISGETTGGGKMRLPGLIVRHSPDVLILELGGNDGLRGFPTKIIRQNLESMINLAKTNGSQVLLLGVRIPPNYGPQYTNQFFNIFQKIADEHDLPVVPFLLEGVALDENLMQRDGIHPNAEAQPAIVESVYPALLPLVQPFFLIQPFSLIQPFPFVQPFPLVQQQAELTKN